MSAKTPINWEQLLSYYRWKILFFKATGGRPMKDQGYNFTDVVSGKSVRNYTDRFGRKWAADSGPWSLFRVRRHDDIVTHGLVFLLTSEEIESRDLPMSRRSKGLTFRKRKRGLQ